MALTVSVTDTVTESEYVVFTHSSFLITPNLKVNCTVSLAPVSHLNEGNLYRKVVYLCNKFI